MRFRLRPHRGLWLLPFCAAAIATTYVEGPGDPTTIVHEDPLLQNPYSLTSAPDGSLYVIHRGTIIHGAGVVLHIPLDRPSVELRAEGAIDVAIDGFGDVLVSRLQSIRRLADDATLVEYTPEQLDYFGQMAVSPIGDIWVAGGLGNRLLRISPDGQFPESVILPFTTSVTDIAYSPDSVMHLVSGNTLYRLAGTLEHRNGEHEGDFEVVYPHGGPLHGLAFDAAGNVYLAAGTDGVLKLDAEFRPGPVPFATSNITDARAIAFMRSSDGSPTRRIVVATGANRIVQLNVGGVEAEGATAFPAAVNSYDAVAELLGAGRLTQNERALLDRNGNDNGSYDIGDVRAYLMRIGAIPMHVGRGDSDQEDRS